MPIYTYDEYQKIKKMNAMRGGMPQQIRQPQQMPNTGLVTPQAPAQPRQYGLMPMLKGAVSAIGEGLFRGIVTPATGVIEGANALTTMAQRPGGFNESKYNEYLQNAINKSRKGLSLNEDETSALSFYNNTLNNTYIDDKNKTRATPQIMRKSDMERYSDENPLVVGGKQALETGSFALPGVAGGGNITKLAVSGAMGGIGATRPNANIAEYGINAATGATVNAGIGLAGKGLSKVFKRGGAPVEGGMSTTANTGSKIADIAEVPLGKSKNAPFKMAGQEDVANNQIQNLINTYKDVPELKPYIPKALSKGNPTEQYYKFLTQLEKHLDNTAIPNNVASTEGGTTAATVLRKALSDLKDENITLFDEAGGLADPKLTEAFNRLGSKNYFGKFKTGELTYEDMFDMRKAMDKLSRDAIYKSVNTKGEEVLAPETLLFKKIRDELSRQLDDKVPQYREMTDASSFIKGLKKEAIPGKAIANSNVQTVHIPYTKIGVNLGNIKNRARLGMNNMVNPISTTPTTQGLGGKVVGGLKAATRQSYVNSAGFDAGVMGSDPATNPRTQESASMMDDAPSIDINEIMRTGYMPAEFLSAQTSGTATPPDTTMPDEIFTADEQGLLTAYTQKAQEYDNMTGPRGGDKYTWKEAQERAYSDLLTKDPSQVTGLNKVRDVINGDYKGTGTGGGKILPAGQLQKLADLETSISLLPDLDTLFQETKSSFGPIRGRINEMNPYNLDAQRAGQVAGLVRQIIGKGLEDGVLRKEDEYKYKQILPKIDDTPALVEAKIQALKDTLKEKKKITIETFQTGGYDPYAGSGGETVVDPNITQYGY